MNTKTKQILLIILFLFSGIYAQIVKKPNRDTDYHRQRYKEGDWVSYSNFNHITSIAIGRTYAYFGTTRGITRYHLYRQDWDTPYTVSDGMADDFVYVVAVDNADYVYAGTNAGLSYYRPTSQEWINISKIQIGITNTETIHSIGIGKNYIWVATYNDFGQHTIYKSSRYSGIFFRSSFSEVQQDEIIWFGFFKFNFQQSQVNIDKNLHSGENYLPLQNPYNILENFKFPIFHITGGYNFISPNIIQDFRFRKYYISYILKDEWWRSVFVGTEGTGAFIGDDRISILKSLNFGFVNSSVQAIAKDGDNLWIAGLKEDNSPRSGITRWNRKANQWEYFESELITDLSSNQITDIEIDGDFIWFSTFEEGVYRYDKNRRRWKNFRVNDGLFTNEINALAVDKNYIWVGTEDGLNVIQKNTSDVTKIKRFFGKKIYDVAVQYNFVWVGTDSGIFKYDDSIDKWRYYRGDISISRHGVTSIAFDKKGGVWFGTLSGVQYFNPKTNEWKGFPSQIYFFDGEINDVAVTDSIIWAGTESGVLRYNIERDTWRIFTKEDGLSHNAVRVIFPEGDYIWFGTPKGLTKFRWKNLRRIDD